MFLDEELFEMCKTADVRHEDYVVTLTQALYRKCEEYYKSKLNPLDTKQVFKATLDKVFNLWDSFVKMLAKSGNVHLVILSELYTEWSFKKQFMDNEEVRKVYESL